MHFYSTENLENENNWEMKNFKYVGQKLIDGLTDAKFLCWTLNCVDVSWVYECCF